MADLNQLAARIVRQSVEETAPEAPEKARMRQGGHKGGRARAKALSASERSEIARNAAQARWAKRA